MKILNNTVLLEIKNPQNTTMNWQSANTRGKIHKQDDMKCYINMKE